AAGPPASRLARDQGEAAAGKGTGASPARVFRRPPALNHSYGGSGTLAPKLAHAPRSEMSTSEKNPFARFLTHFNQGHVLFHEGDDGEDMYIIQSGRVAIKKRVKDGDTTLAVLEKGDFFGEMAILERMPRSATAEVIE